MYVYIYIYIYIYNHKLYIEKEILNEKVDISMEDIIEKI